MVRILKYKGIENHNTYLIKCNQDESAVQESWIAQSWVVEACEPIASIRGAGV